MEYVTVVIHSAAQLRPRCAAALVNLARRSWGKAAWRRMEAELFPGAYTLLIARPQLRVSVADYALPLLARYKKE